MFRFPFTNFHELNLDWILAKVKEFAELIPPMQTAVDDVQEAINSADEAITKSEEALENASEAVETANEAKDIAEQAAQGAIADGAVTTAKLADNAVSTDKIQNGAITQAKLSAALQAKILKGSTTPIPSANDSTVVVLNGLTTSHYVVHWGFSTSAENDPPCDISIVAGNGSYTIFNNGGNTNQTVTPLFVSPLNI